MKAYVFLIAACLIACAHGFPGARREVDFEDDPYESTFDVEMSNMFAEAMNKIRKNLLNYFWNMPDITNIQIPDGANTTSTTKIINGHVVTINETTYTSGDENGGTAFRIRIIDVKPQNDTILSIGGDVEPITAKPEATESAETIEEFNNEIPKNTETLIA